MDQNAKLKRQDIFSQQTASSLSAAGVLQRSQTIFLPRNQCEVTSAYFSGPDSSPYHRKNPRSNHHVRFSLPSPRPDETSPIEAPQNASVEGAQTPDKAAARADSRSRKAHADPKHGRVTAAPSEADAGDCEKTARGYGSGCVSAAARAVAQSRALRCVSLTGVD